MGEIMKDASISVAMARRTAGDFSMTVVNNVYKNSNDNKPADYRIVARRENVAG